jgi:heme o synthase
MNTKTATMEKQWLPNIAAYFELTKPRVTLLVVLTAAAGFYLASPGQPDLLLLLHMSLGTTLLSAGTAVLNQFLEREADGRMHRTRNRPLPSGRLNAFPAMVFGTALIVGGTLHLDLFTNHLAALLGFSTCVIYLFVYTPLKPRTALCTTVGAIPGALPPLIGWAAARGELDFHAVLLFAILFSWQFPHFLAISWIYKEDYERGGFIMLPSFDPDGVRTARRILFFSFLLLVLSIIPAVSGLTGALYLGGALLLGLTFLAFGLKATVSRSRASVRYLLRASVVYLPLLLILMVIDKT